MSKFKLTQTAAEVQDILNNSLQKPTGLTKTELVGVGVNGQEKIEIGDNLTLANGKLSAAGGLSSTVKFDSEGNRTVGKNLGVDGKLTLKSLVSESNPDGDITKELGGGSSKITITETKSDWSGDGQDPRARWSSYEGRALKPNTAYEIGDTVSVEFLKEFNNKTLNSNQIFVPGTAMISIYDNNYTLKYGDVVLALTDANIRLNVRPSRPENTCKITANCYLTYTVIKAGTTGANVSLKSSGWGAVYSYVIYTLGISAQ